MKDNLSIRVRSIGGLEPIGVKCDVNISFEHQNGVDIICANFHSDIGDHQRIIRYPYQYTTGKELDLETGGITEDMFFSKTMNGFTFEREHCQAIIDAARHHFPKQIADTKTQAKLFFEKIDELIAKMALPLENLISRIPQDIFLNTVSLTKIDAWLMLNNSMELRLIPEVLWASEINRTQYTLERVTNWGKTRYYYIFKSDTEQRIIEDFLLPFGKILANNLNVDLPYANLLMYGTIHKYAITYFHNKCIDNFGLADDAFQECDLNSSIQKLINMDILNIESEHTQALLTYFLMCLGKFQNNYNFIECVQVFQKLFSPLYDKHKEELKTKQFENLLYSNPVTTAKSIDIFEIDLMTGTEFEKTLGTLFSKRGYQITYTKTTGDQGIDIIAEKNSVKIGIQAKRYDSAVGNSAVQEAVAGKAFYNLTKVMVITNSHFTPSAIDLAQKNDVILWDRDKLKENLL